MASKVAEPLNKELLENKGLAGELKILQHRQRKDRRRSRQLGLASVSTLPEIRQRKSLPGQLNLF